MSEPRSYLIGLPVCVTVHDDGRVEYEVDKAETTSGMTDTYAADQGMDNEYANMTWDEEQMLLDCAIVDAHRADVGTDLPAATLAKPLACPAGNWHKPCGFKGGIPEMDAHLRGGECPAMKTDTV